MTALAEHAFEAAIEPVVGRLALYVRHRGASVLGAEWDEDDLLQEALARAWRLFDRFEPHGPDGLFAWLRALADGVVADRVKYRRAKGRGGVRHLESLAGRPDGPGGGAARAPLEPAAPGTTVTRLAAQREARARVLAALDALAPQHREVVLRHLLAGETLAEVATALGVTKNAVWERLRRGLAALRAALPADLGA